MSTHARDGELEAVDRPRERMLSAGASGLSDADLLAILIGAGVAGRRVDELAAALLARFGGLRGLAQAGHGELGTERGIGPARTALIRAALELGRRAVGERPARGVRVASGAEVWMHMRARLALEPVEEFWALALDVRHRVQAELRLARGSLGGVEVHPRDVFRPLIRESAAAVVFCHNHPSGDPTPSQQDILLTARLREVGELCGIVVLDHVVVAADGYSSMAERGWGVGAERVRAA